MAIICEKCGSSVDARETLCPVCGFPLDPEPDENTPVEKTVSSYHFSNPRFAAPKDKPRDEKFGSDREWTDRPKSIDDNEPGFVMSEKHSRRIEANSDTGPQSMDFRSDTIEEMYPNPRRTQKTTIRDIDPEKIRDTSRELEKVLGKVKPSQQQSIRQEEESRESEAVHAPKAVAPRSAPPPVPRNTGSAGVPRLRPKAEALVKKISPDEATPAWVRDTETRMPEAAQPEPSQSFDETQDRRSEFKLEAPIEPQYKNPRSRAVAPRRKPAARDVDNSDTLPIMSKIREKEEFTEEIQVVAANFPARTAAGAIDQAIVLVISYIFIRITIWIMGAEFIPEARGVFSLLADYPVILPSCVAIYLFIFLLYTVWMDSLTGQTVGKMLLKLRLVQMDGERPHPLRAAIRQAAYFISLMIFGLGHFLVLFDPRKQSLHDKIAGTLVIRCTE